MEILKLLNSFFQEKRQSKQYFYALKYSNKEIFSIKKKHNNSFDMQVLFSQPFPKLPLNFVCFNAPDKNIALSNDFLIAAYILLIYENWKVF